MLDKNLVIQCVRDFMKSNIYQRKNKYTYKYAFYIAKADAFSLIELLFTVFIVGIISITLLKSLLSLKKQDYAIQGFLTKHVSLFETQLFINKHLSIAKKDSILAMRNSLYWESFASLYNPTKHDDTMDFSLQTLQNTISLRNGNLYFNNELLLDNVSNFEAQITHNIATNTDDSRLTYTICMQLARIQCIDEILFLDNLEISKS